MHNKGDESKQPEICRNPVFTPYSDEFPKPSNPFSFGDGEWSKCPHIQYIQDTDMSGENYKCDHCGKSYTLYYEDMA